MSEELKRLREENRQLWSLLACIAGRDGRETSIGDAEKMHFARERVEIVKDIGNRKTIIRLVEPAVKFTTTPSGGELMQTKDFTGYTPASVLKKLANWELKY